MNSLAHKRHNTTQRAARVRSRIQASSERPRMSIFISNQHVSAQIIDDTKSITVAAASTVGSDVKGTLTEKAAWVGSEIAKKAAKAKVKQVSFDRGSKRYHGRIKALADAARNAGLEF